MPVVRAATRGSALAVWQAAHVGRLLEAAYPGIEVEFVVVDTEGDRRLDVPISELLDEPAGFGFAENAEPYLPPPAHPLAMWMKPPYGLVRMKDNSLDQLHISAGDGRFGGQILLVQGLGHDDFQRLA